MDYQVLFNWFCSSSKYIVMQSIACISLIQNCSFTLETFYSGIAPSCHMVVLY